MGSDLLKKFLIADYLAENLINRVFDLPKLYSGTEVLLGVYGYALQLYYDFSGYTDIAIGSALLLGIKLPHQFQSSLRRAKYRRLLAALAHLVFQLAARLLVFLAARPALALEDFHLREPGPHHGDRRTVAWRELDVS